MNTLTCPLPLFQRLLRALAEEPHRPAFVRVGIRRDASDGEWLARDLLRSIPAPERGAVFQIALTGLPPAVGPLPPAMDGALYLGDVSWRGHLWGVVRLGDAVQPLHHLSLVGAGMHRVPIRNPDLMIGGAHPSFHPHPQRTDAPPARWSRTIGALGGEAIWERLIRLRVGMIGCGRTGSLAAATLARLGLHHLTLIDPDRLEPHNLGEMDAATDADVGRPKAQAIADHLHTLFLHFPASPSPIVAPISDSVALTAAKGCDVLFCCADNDAARLATARLAWQRR